MPALFPTRYLIFVPLLLLSALICSCGGGGGGVAKSGAVVDPSGSYHGSVSPAMVSAANAEDLAMGGFAGKIVGGDVATIGRAKTVHSEQRAEAMRLVQSLKLSSIRLAIPEKAAQLRKKTASKVLGKQLQRQSTFQVPGDNGGNATFTLEVNDSTGNFFGTVTYHGFTSGDVTADGSCDILGSFDPNRQALSQMTLSFRALSMTGAADTDVLTGSLSWAYTYTSSRDALSMNMVLNSQRTSKTYWFKDYRVDTVYGNGFATQTISGRYYDHDNGYVDLSTDRTLVVDYASQWPSEGTLFFSAAAGRWARINFQGNAFTIEAETSGDGLVDWRKTNSGVPAQPVNSPPVAQAGPDQTVTVGSAVHLDGTASSDSDGNTLSYSWSFIAVPAGVNNAPTLTGANTATPSFTAPSAGTFSLRLTVFDGSSSSQDTVTVIVNPAAPLQPSAVKQTWQFGIYGSCIGEAGLLTTDLDGDGVPEIIATASSGGFGDNTMWYVVRKNTAGGYDQVWRSENYGATIVKLLLADMNQDGKKDVVVAFSDGTIRSYNGSNMEELPRLTVANSLRDLAVTDLDRDGHLELVTTDGTTVRVYSVENGALRWSKNGCGGTSLAVGNVDTDANLEIVTTGYGGKGYVIDGVSGTVKWEYANGFGALVRLADLDGDGRQEIVAASAWYKITIFDADLKSPAWEISTDLDIGAVTIADTDGDGIPEIIYGDSQWGKVHAVDARTHLQRWSVNNPEHGVSGIAVGDVDLDGKRELLWGAGGSSTGPDYLYIADFTSGTIKWQNQDFSGLSALAVGDLKADGTDQLLMVSAYSNSSYDEGIINIFDLANHNLAVQKKLGIRDWMGSARVVRIGDLEGDGKNEFVVTTANLYDGLIQVYDGATHTVKRQTAGYDGNFFSALALGDVDGDGKTEIVAGQGREHTGAKGVYLIVFDGVTMQEKWKSVDLGTYWGAVYDIKLADLNKDGKQDIVVSVGGSRLIVYDGVSHVQKCMLDLPARAIEVADVDGDGFPEILVGRTDGRIEAYDGVTFTLKSVVANVGTSPIDALKAADLDGNGSMKFVVASGGELRVFQGQSLYWRSGVLGNNLGKSNSIAVKDTDHDGHPNIFIGTDVTLYQFKYLGAQ